MDRYQRIDAAITEGYDLVQRGDSLRGCKIWLQAWEEIKELFAEGVAEDIFDLNGKYKWGTSISNYAQFLEMELHNAGVDDEAYHQKRVEYCRELIRWCKDDLTINNTRIGMAEAHYEMGEYGAGDRVFDEWLREDPDCGMCYAGWSDCHRMTLDAGHYGKAEEILLAGYARPGLRDRHYVAEGLVNLYNQMGEPEKAGEYIGECRELPAMRQEWAEAAPKPKPVRVVKIGRNEPCPCGSGKKYKKCCGA